MNEKPLHTTSLTRRNLLGMASMPLAMAQRGAPELLKPRALAPGDTVAVIMPSTPVPDPDRLASVERTLAHFGLKLKKGRYLGRRTTSFPQSIDERVAELHEAFADPDVKGVFPVGGGYGTMQILDRLDFSIIRRHPKIFTGYSDITALHLAFHKIAGLVTFHSPVVLSAFSPYSQDYFRRALFEPRPLGVVRNPAETNPIRPQHPWRTVRPGTARGRLVGGNLTLISTTLGTPWEIDTRGRIFFIEDVGEETYSIDRMLTQLHLAGKFRDCVGVVWGECADCGPGVYKPSTATPFTLGETIDNLLGRLDVPVLSGLTIGHTADQATLPLGVMATLDATRGELTIEEAATLPPLAK
jgi:muramoyltetrapeptide carboxypeptidase